MEDVKIAYDGTVRNEINTIIQFSYGTDGFDAKSSERQHLSFIMGSNNDFVNKFKWKRNELKKYLSNSVLKGMKRYTKILEDEFKEIEIVRKYFIKNIEEDFIYAPINIYRIIEQSKKKYRIHKDTVNDISPTEMIKMRKVLLDKLKVLYDDHPLAVMMNEESLKRIKYNLICHLSTKKLITSGKINKQAYEWIIRKIEDKFYASIIHPGEMVGPIAAQSLGERCTQLSVTPDTEVRLAIGGKKTVQKIGEFIDNCMELYDPYKTHITEDGKASYILPTPDELDIKVPGLNYETQKVQWKRITELSKHPPNGKLVKITTKSGKTVTATLSHSFVSRDVFGKPYTIRGDRLRKGMYVPVIKD